MHRRDSVRHSFFLLLLFCIGMLSTARLQALGESAIDRDGSPQLSERDAGLVRVALEVVREIEFCALITVDSEGAAQARTMQPFAPESDLTVWFGTRKGTRKLDQLRLDPRATLYYSDPEKGAYVTLLGSIEIVTAPVDRSHRWNEQWQAFYDDGARGDDFVLLRFSPHRLELMSVADGVAAEPKGWKPAIVELGHGALVSD